MYIILNTYLRNNYSLSEIDLNEKKTFLVHESIYMKAIFLWL